MQMLSFDQALAQLVRKAQPLQRTQTLPVGEALGRVLAEPVVSPMAVPPHDNSQMDGYALHSFDLTHGQELPISQRIAAGDHADTPLESGTAARIFTGAPIPPDANAVVMQENAEMVDDTRIRIKQPSVAAGENIRRKGEDIAKGATILEPGQRLRPQDLGLIASIGQAEVTVYVPLKVATFTTGDELLAPGEDWQPGKIFNANHSVIQGMMQQWGVELVDLGRIPDDATATRRALQQASEQADAIITTGGVSVGEEDHLKPAVEALGSLDLWRVKMKPGKPLAFGFVNDTPFIGLPGNPVSAFATCYLFARAFLLRMQGAEDVYIKPYWVKADFDWPQAGFRREFARAQLVSGPNYAETKVVLYPQQGSGVLTSTVWGEGFVVIEEDTTVSQGDTVAFLPFDAFQ
ncbi:molybdopterin molybdotransferase MoeA [Hydrogenovibrio halophilus]|uniref:molybdopterin molybdotransferase MoeA n=1 Tax=Hydrogenovibrio halophilus TaxID=373391 RepID=UPI00036BA8BF|nr:gephyrin-like molybdotransferase Glp [Hydrogenovibrio halophilus]